MYVLNSSMSTPSACQPYCVPFGPVPLAISSYLISDSNCYRGFMWVCRTIFLHTCAPYCNFKVKFGRLLAS